MRAIAHTAVLAALLLSGCARIVDLPPGLPDSGRIVREVTIKGNKKVKGVEIRAGLEAHPPEGHVRIEFNPYDPDAVAADRLRIESFYQKEGFFEAKVKEVRTYPVRERYMDLEFVVDEGKPTLLRMVGVSGVPKQPTGLEKRVFDSLGVAVGDRYTEESYIKAKQKLARLMAESGYAFAELEGQVRVDRKARQAAIRFTVDAGPLVTLGKGSVSGLENYPAATVKKRIAWKPGQQYHPDLIDRTRKDILGLQRFVSMRPDLGDRTATTVSPKLVLSESKRNELRLGGGFAADPLQCRVRGRAGYIRRGFLGELNTLTIDARPAYAFPCIISGDGEADVDGFVGEALVAIDRTDFPFDFFTSRVQVGYQFDELEAYTTAGPRLALQTRRRFFKQRVRMSIGWGFTFDTFSEVRIDDSVLQETGIPEEKKSQRVGFFRQSVALDFRDQVLAPTRGFFGRIQLEEGSPIAGGENTYYRVNPEVRGYYTPFYHRDEEGVRYARLTFAARVAGGSDLEGDTLPVTRRFFSGGASRHRGFPQRTLSPTALGKVGTTSEGTQLAIGGSSMFETNLELRMLIYGRWGAVFFADGGDTTNELSGVDLANLHWALGVGLRIRTPVGPVRVDLGFRASRSGARTNDVPNPRPTTKLSQRFVLHLSLGEAF